MKALIAISEGGFILLGRAVLAITALLAPVAAFSQAQGKVAWSAQGAASTPAGVRVQIKLQAVIQEGWHVYSVSQPPGGPTTCVISISGKQPFRQDGPLQPPKVHRDFDPNFNMETETYEGSVDFKIPVRVASDAAVGGQELRIDVLYQACNETTCLPPQTAHVSVPIKIIKNVSRSDARIGVPTRSLTAEAETTSSLGGAAREKTDAQNGGAATAQSLVTTGTVIKGGQSRSGLGAFLWFAAAMGALSLLTPCVFPMVPITVSYFTNHAGASRKSAVVTALVYGIGIILTFTALGMLLAVIFGAGGVNQLAASPWVNLFITAIFLGFAFSLFGAYFIQVPPGLMNKLVAITRSKEGSGVIGALLMGFTFTLTSFTCTAPFVGTLLVMTAQGNWRWPLAGMLAFSTVFAIPFFILALAPQLMSKLPKAGGWMVQVKVVMGFLEIAAAMKFLSNADLVWHWGIFTRQVVLAVWVGIGVLTVLYVLGYFRMDHDTPVESVGAARVAVAIMFLATTIWLVPGLFGRQLGELESFLPPEIGVSASPPSTSPASSAKLQDEVGWILNDYEGALAFAKQQNKLVFVDFTGYTCTNCRWMEANMFPRPEVAKEMEHFVRVRLYTDGKGELFERQQKMQQEKFGTVALPYYAILRPDGSAVTTYSGLTRNANEFVKFLQEAHSL